MTELNKKLADWSGIFINSIGDEHWIGLSTENKVIHLEPFTQSLDACFGWLVPKARGGQESFNVDFDYLDDVIRCFITRDFDTYWADAGRKEKSPEALSLARAMEKLIDGEQSVNT